MTGPRSLPPGWPVEVHPPGTPDWERTAVAWLFDQCPPDYRAYDVLRRHPRVLGRFAAAHLEAGVSATEQGLRTVRADLADLPPEVVEAAVSAFDRERQRLRAARRAADLVERALRGQTWTARL
jgi:hypothetical protein